MKPTSSYPYMRIAREMGLPYWAVLILAENQMNEGEPERVYVPGAREAIEAACSAEDLKRFWERVTAAIAEFRIIQAEGWD